MLRKARDVTGVIAGLFLGPALLLLAAALTAARKLWPHSRRPRMPLVLLYAWTWRRRHRVKNHYTAMPDHTGRPLSDQEWRQWKEIAR